MPIFYRLQNYCFFVKYTIAYLMKRCTIIKSHSYRVNGTIKKNAPKDVFLIEIKLIKIGWFVFFFERSVRKFNVSCSCIFLVIFSHSAYYSLPVHYPFTINYIFLALSGNNHTCSRMRLFIYSYLTTCRRHRRRKWNRHPTNRRNCDCWNDNRLLKRRKKSCA